jgi:hypothetical protein
MAGDLLFRKPSIAVIQGDSEPMYGVVAATATVTYLKPGKLLSMLTNTGEVDIAGEADASFNLGILGYEYTPDEYRPATRDTIYAVGDHVAIHAKPGMRFRGFLMNSAAVNPGDTLYHSMADTSGNFTKWTSTAVATDAAIPLAKAMEVAASSSGTSPVECWMEWL